MKAKIRRYWSLTKSLQTGLLLATGLAGYMSARCPVFNLSTVLGISVSLFLAISGSTVLNMWFDRDIDGKMKRTCWRPLPANEISAEEGLILGLVLSTLGVGLALAMDMLFGGIVFAGLFFDVVVYTIWLKRRTAWAIVWGGLSGGMPVLAGRSLGLGQIEWVGIALMLAVVFWIPTHILTFTLRYNDDYSYADIPTFPLTYGFEKTRKIIAVSSVFTGIAMVVSAVGIGISFGFLRLLGILSVGLLFLAGSSYLRPSEKLNFGLFKYASFYMLGAMLLIAFDGV
jgi:protoheme IX farnesyltransferase